MRESWDRYFMNIAELVSTRATCVRRKVGAVIVRDKNILATGYNGAPRRVEHCTDETCLRQKLNIPSGERHEICRAVHAEQNAIIQAARHGVAVNGASLYITVFPCSICAKMIINSGISKIYFEGDYGDARSTSQSYEYLWQYSSCELYRVKEDGTTVLTFPKPK